MVAIGRRRRRWALVSLRPSSSSSSSCIGGRCSSVGSRWPISCRSSWVALGRRRSSSSVARRPSSVWRPAMDDRRRTNNSDGDNDRRPKSDDRRAATNDNPATDIRRATTHNRFSAQARPARWRGCALHGREARARACVRRVPWVARLEGSHRARHPRAACAGGAARVARRWSAGARAAQC